ncbi:MAG: response regulator, partial [Pseudomonadota bacterium]
LVLDYQLGTGMTGIDLFVYLQSQHDTIPAVMISASRSEELLSDCAELGIPFLPKPLDPIRLRRFFDEMAANELLH